MLPLLRLPVGEVIIPFLPNNQPQLSKLGEIYHAERITTPICLWTPFFLHLKFSPFFFFWKKTITTE